MANKQLVDVIAAKSFIEANWPNDPLLKQIAFNLLDKLPRADAVEHGIWTIRSGANWQMPMCSVCGNQATIRYKYCPNCGANMDGDMNGS